MPRTRVKNLILYVLGRGAELFDMRLLCFVTMGSHYHLLVEDSEACLPAFMEYVNGQIARAMNTLIGRRDKFFSGDGYLDLRPQTPSDIIERYRYILANPLAADLVRYAADYPGLWTGPKQIGRTMCVPRPDFFYREGGSTPAQVEVTFEVPSAFESDGVEGFRNRIADIVRQEEKRNTARRKRAGRSVLGRRRLEMQRWDDVATSDEQWFRLKPRVAARDPKVRCEAIRRLNAFWAEYKVAWSAYREGDLEVEFPPGAWWWPRYAHCACRGPS